MTILQINHYEKLEKYLPRGYITLIRNECGVSTSLINKVLRGERDDTKGILVQAYKIANDEKARQEAEAKELASLKKSFKK